MSQGVKRKRADVIVASRKKKLVPGKIQPLRSGPVNGQDLKWKEVSVSKRLEDAEGFYGLEELSDVEVVQDLKGKGISFRPLINDLEEAADPAQDQNAEEEWSGFDDDDDEQPKNTSDSEMRDNGSASHFEDRVNGVRSAKPGNASDELAENTNFNVLSSEAPEVEVDMTDWQSLELSRPLLYALSALKFSTPTEIQRLAMPYVMAGKDVIGKAVTGSGKTLAFGVPMIENWLQTRMASKARSGCTGLVLAPTRELAHQISKHLGAICEGLDHAPRLATVTGGLSVLKQQRQLETAAIVVATPGRLWEVISDSDVLMKRLQSSRYLVLDEADRLLSEGHFKEVEDIIDALDRKEYDEEEAEPENEQTTQSRQILVFSATFHKDLRQKLSSKNKKRKGQENGQLSDKKSMEYLIKKLPFQDGQKPTFVDANPDSQLAEKLSETIIECKAMEKDLYLYTYLIQDAHNRHRLSGESRQARILVFTNSVSAVKRLVPLLQSLNLPSTTMAPLHSNMPQKSRLRSLEKFSGADTPTEGVETSILIATDVAARGLDIKGVTTIVHYHVPRTADTYIHRSGRTARINDSGSSILICSPDETADVTKLIARLHTSTTGHKAGSNVDRMYLPNDLLRQVAKRIELAQKLIDMTQSRDKVKSEDNWLRNAAEELGVDYDSDEFEVASKQGRRGRGGEKQRRQKKAAKDEDNVHKTARWKAQLREELGERIDFGDGATRNMKYLAGGAVDVDQLLAERSINDNTSTI